MTSTPATPARPAFQLMPAIDLQGGRVVRLIQGRFDAATDYGDDVVGVARGFRRDGCPHLHVIDLDAARSGERPAAHRDAIARVAAERDPDGILQIGGGLRSEEAVAEAVELGVDRVLVGTAAFRDPVLLDRLVARFGARVCVTADTLGGSVRVAGWEDDTGEDAVEAVRRLSARGVEAFLVTAIERDGTLAGPDLRLLAQVRAATAGVLLASGGVATAEHLRAVRELGCDGAVVGRALLSGALSVGDALAAVR